MCGICGIFHFDRARDVDPTTLETMNQRMVHRGPDDAGIYLSHNVGLAVRRLSIIDLASGHQPVCNEDGSIWMVFNGEIYNHAELRRQLAARGHRYRSQTDTETIVHLYEEYGRECARYLRGMFAFALWDRPRRVLFAARDRIGIKPFYYWRDRETFLFASEIKSLLGYPAVCPELNRDALPEYLAFGYLSGGGTLFRGIQKILPGHTLEIDESGAMGIEPYWDLNPSNGGRVFPKSYYVETYRAMLEDAVSSHLMSDVPVGVFLSGGVDSSAIAAVMTKMRGESIDTFSVGYEESPHSELSYARRVAQHIGSRHHEVRVGSEAFFDALPTLIFHEDEPLAWPSSVPLYFLARLAREHVTVVLTGEGSDETLAGYARYPWTLWNERLDRLYRHLAPARLRRWINDAVKNLRTCAPGLQRKLSHTFVGREGGSWISLYFDNFYTAFSGTDLERLLADTRGWTPGLPYRNVLRGWNGSVGTLLDRMLYTDIKTYLVELCMKQDAMSMAASVESRVPFLDHRLVEFAARIPPQYHTRGLTGKCILKSAVRDLLPHSILHRRKMGFPTPFREWLTGRQLEEVERLLLEPRSLERDLFRPDAVRQYLTQHRACQAGHSDKIWRLLNLELWHRVFIDGGSHGQREVPQAIAVQCAL
jgi:asparagine synthase (glutamine-hydrolysing)